MPKSALQWFLPFVVCITRGTDKEAQLIGFTVRTSLQNEMPTVGMI